MCNRAGGVDLSGIGANGGSLTIGNREQTQHPLRRSSGSRRTAITHHDHRVAREARESAPSSHGDYVAHLLRAQTTVDVMGPREMKAQFLAIKIMDYILEMYIWR